MRFAVIVLAFIGFVAAIPVSNNIVRDADDEITYPDGKGVYSSNAKNSRDADDEITYPDGKGVYASSAKNSRDADDDVTYPDGEKGGLYASNEKNS